MYAALPQCGLPRLLRDARLGKGLTKRETARQLGVCVDVVGQWERGEHAPRIQYYPAIIEFLGNEGWLDDQTLADRVRRYRSRKGWSQARLGQQIGVSERTIGRWERGQTPPAPERGLVEQMLADANEAQAKGVQSAQRGRR